jgi:hypothetical protein
MRFGNVLQTHVHGSQQYRVGVEGALVAACGCCVLLFAFLPSHITTV